MSLLSFSSDRLNGMAVSAALLMHLTPALAAETRTYEQGYEAGYRAAMEALKAGAVTAPAAAPVPVPQPTPAAGPAVAGTVAAEPKASPVGPPDWWDHSSLLYPQLDPRLRHHLELQLSGTSVSGNDDGHSVHIGAKLYSRMNRWTNEFIANVDKRAINQSGSMNRRDFRMVEESIRYDLNDQLYASAGYIWEKDDVNYIDSRHTVLAGLGYYLFDNARMRLNVFAGLGRLDETYLEPVPSLVGSEGRDSGLLYLYQSFEWQLSENWSVQQGFRQIRDLDASNVYVPDPATGGATYIAGSTVKRYRNVANLALTYQLSPRSALSLGLESRHDSDPWPDVKPKDTVRRLSVNLMY